MGPWDGQSAGSWNDDSVRGARRKRGARLADKDLEGRWRAMSTPGGRTSVSAENVARGLSTRFWTVDGAWIPFSPHTPSVPRSSRLANPESPCSPCAVCHRAHAQAANTEVRPPARRKHSAWLWTSGPEWPHAPLACGEASASHSTETCLLPHGIVNQRIAKDSPN